MPQPMHAEHPVDTPTVSLTNSGMLPGRPGLPYPDPGRLQRGLAKVGIWTLGPGPDG